MAYPYKKRSVLPCSENIYRLFIKKAGRLPKKAARKSCLITFTAKTR